MQHSKPERSGPDLDYRNNITLAEIPAEGKEILKKYSGIEEDDLLPHILAVREKAFRVAPYPCIGQVRFLGNRWPEVDYMGEVFLPRLRKGETLLDVGCGLGQDLRFLHWAYDVPSAQLFGTDIQQGLLDAGYDLFRDSDQWKGAFVRADMLDPASPALDTLRGTQDLIHASQFFHCFDWDEQFKAAKSVALLSRGAGSTVAGTQVGSRAAGSYEVLKACAVSGWHYRHNKDSLTRLWNDVGAQTGTTWRVEYHEIASSAVEASRTAWWSDAGMTMFSYSATRL